MSTTLTAAYSAGDELFVFHVGHSRAYLYRGGLLTRLTRDQTLAQRLSETGRTIPTELAAHDLRHVLTDAHRRPRRRARHRDSELPADE